jgi:hypothetical protein
MISSSPAWLRLRYRQVNQSEKWQTVEMKKGASGGFEAQIPADYTDSPYPLQYYFQIHDSSDRTRLFPDFNPGWQGQPYFVIRQA